MDDDLLGPIEDDLFRHLPAVLVSCLLALGIFVWARWNDDGLIGRMRYAWTYRLLPNNVKFAPKPHDCDWLSTPLGAKHCTYEPRVAVYNEAPRRVEIDWAKIHE